MVSVMSLWMPILLSAVAAFIASSIIHMVLGYHRTDFAKVTDEDALQGAFRNLKVAPGDYMLPFAGSSEEMKSAAFKARYEQGPSVVMTVLPPGPINMGMQLGQWFVYCVVVSLFAAYLAASTMAPGSEYLDVFCVTCTVAFAGYALALWQGSIWYKRSLSYTIKSTLDGLAYSLLTGGVFGWLWP